MILDANYETAVILYEIEKNGLSDQAMMKDMADLKDHMQTSGLYDNFIKNMQTEEPFRCKIAIVQNICYELNKKIRRYKQFKYAHAEIRIYLMDNNMNDWHYFTTRNIDAGKLFPEIQRVIEETILFMDNTGDCTDYTILPETKTAFFPQNAVKKRISAIKRAINHHS